MPAVHNPDWRIRPGLAGRYSVPADPKLGLNKLGSHKPKLKLGDYLEDAAPPAAVGRPHPGFGWGMLANDRLGDCVCAMILHSIEDMHLDAGTPVPGFTDDDAIALYEKIGGYDPKDPNTDQGCDESVAMSTWEQGLPKTSDGVVHKIAGTVSVDPSNLAEVRSAIYEFVDVQVGIALPVTAQGQAEWEVVGDPNSDPNSEPGSWGGHGIPANAYDAETFQVITWGAPLLMTVGFWQAYVQETHVVVTQEMLNKSGVGPSGVDWDALLSDLKALTSASGRKVGKSDPKVEDELKEVDDA